MSHKEQAEQGAAYAARIMQLERGYDELRKVNNRLQARLAEKDETIDRMQGLLETCDKSMDTLRARLAEATQIIEAVADDLGLRAIRSGLVGCADRFLERATDSAPAVDDDAGHDPACRQLREPLGYCDCNAASAEPALDLGKPTKRTLADDLPGSY
jgi:hypothetical protein